MIIISQVEIQGIKFIDTQSSQFLHFTIVTGTFSDVCLPQHTFPQFWQKELDLFLRATNWHSFLFRAWCAKSLVPVNATLTM